MANGTTVEFIGGEKDRASDSILIVPLTVKPKPAMEMLSLVDEYCDDGVSELISLGAVRSEVGHLAHTTRNGRYRRVMVVSLGDRDELDAARIRTAAISVTRWMIAEQIPKACLWIDALAAAGVDRATAEWAAGMVIGGFRFTEHRGNDDAKAVRKLRIRLSSGTPGHVSRTLPQVGEARRLADAVNYARALAHQPANIIHPTSLAAEARKLARTHKMKCTVLDVPQLKKLGMNGLIAVGAGAAHPSKLIRLEYKAAPRSRNTTVLVGKAVTFDTGGYSIKSKDGLETLKYDKCGGMTVMGVMKAAALLHLKCNLIALIPAAENAISAQAYRPGDIIKMASGKTVEVISTDAEGRLILADALWYAQKYLKPTALINIATLTGGVRAALGTAAAGLMSNDDDLAAELGESGRATNERLWRLPLWDEYRELIRGTDSDIKNSAGKRDAHCIVGGMFLKEFVNDGVPWAHIDIANVATSDSGQITGATGFGVRLLVDYLKRHSA